MIIRADETHFTGWRHDDTVAGHEDAVWHIIQIDYDRYSGAYSGAPFTAWPGIRPSDLDDGDIECMTFWEQNANTLHGKGYSAQEAFRNLVEKIESGGLWDVDVTLKVVMLESCLEPCRAFLYDSEEFRQWIAEGQQPHGGSDDY